MNTPPAVAADTLSLLNRLIVAEKNGENALRAAAEEAWHADLKQSLMTYSHFFGDAARDLQRTVVALGGTPRERGSFDTTLHCTWMHLRAVALGRDEAAILDDVQRDETEAEQLLADALRMSLPIEVRGLLERQHEWVRRHHDTVQSLRTRRPSHH